MKTLILGLGNDLLGDDAVGIIAARRLGNIVGGSIDVIECNVAGMALLDVMVDYDRAIILDAFHSGKHHPGTVLEMSVDDLRPIPGMSPHYVGLPEVISIGRRLGLEVPDVISIVAAEIPECLTIGKTLSETAAYSVIEMTDRAMNRIKEWEDDVRIPSLP